MGMTMENIPCFILGNAPSLKDLNLEVLNEYFTVGINRIFYKYDPTVLIWQDLALWSQEKNRVMQTKAIKYVREGSENRGGFYGFKLKDRDARLPTDLRTLYGRGSSGSIAYQFTYALGCNPIILVGMDCSYSNGLTDFYGNNPMHKLHTLPGCNKALEFIKRSGGGRVIINCSKNKVFEDYQEFENVVKSLPESGKGNREIFQKRLLGNNYSSVMKIMFE
jgi:hypothetical protein